MLIIVSYQEILIIVTELMDLFRSFFRRLSLKEYYEIIGSRGAIQGLMEKAL